MEVAKGRWIVYDAATLTLLYHHSDRQVAIDEGERQCVATGRMLRISQVGREGHMTVLPPTGAVVHA